jgi:YidC/Oxa1 family membrane protein insertase
VDLIFELIADAFHYGLVVPMTNVLVAIARVFGGNFGIAIILFTIIMRLVTWPLTASQYKQSKAMQSIQPKLAALQKQYKGKDQKKYQQEMMALYREHGVNPLGCLFPMLVQMPIWIALYQVIRLTLGEVPESYVTLSQNLYPIPFVHTAVPLDQHFLIWNLGVPDPLYILPILVGLTMYVQQKMITPAPPADQQLTQQQLQQQQTQQMMTWMLPLMFAYFTVTVPSGLGLYWFVSNLAGIVTQYFYMGRRIDWSSMLRFGPATPGGPGGTRGRAGGGGRGGAQPQQKPQPAKTQRAPEPEPVASDETEDEAAIARRMAGGGGGQRRKRHGRRRGRR